MIDAFITFADRPGGPAAFFANEREPINVFRKVVSALSILVGDGLVVCSQLQVSLNTHTELYTDISLFRYLVSQLVDRCWPDCLDGRHF